MTRQMSNAWGTGQVIFANSYKLKELVVKSNELLKGFDFELTAICVSWSCNLTTTLYFCTTHIFNEWVISKNAKLRLIGPGLFDFNLSK